MTVLIYIVITTLLTNLIITVGWMALDDMMYDPVTESEKIRRIYEIKDEVLAIDEVERFMVFYTHNGGGYVRAGSLFNISPYYGNSEMISKFKGIVPDVEYIKMLNDLEITNTHNYYTRLEKEDSLLNDIYRTEGIGYSFIKFLGIKREEKKFINLVFPAKRVGIYFCSISKSNGSEFTTETKLLINKYLQELEKLLK